MIIQLDMTPEQWEKLEEAVQDYQDCGPPPDGWASPELQEVRRIVSEARSNHA